MWLKYNEEKGMVYEWCVEDKQTLVTQNVLNSNRQTDRQTDMFLFGVLYKESTLTTIPNS